MLRCRRLRRNELKDFGDCAQASLGSTGVGISQTLAEKDKDIQQIVVNLLETLVAQMIPGRSVTIEHSRRFDELLVVATALALERVVRLAGCVVLVYVKVLV